MSTSTPAPTRPAASDLRIPNVPVIPEGACQRWDRRVQSWRRRRDGGFDPGPYAVARIPENLAAPFVRENHYAASMPAARFCFGLFADDLQDVRGALVGVAVLSIPMRERVLSSVFPDLEPYVESLELGRFVLTSHVPANGETWFLARVLRQAVELGVRGVVSFSDPVARYRTADDGSRVCTLPGHVGTIYQAANAVACGRSAARTQLVVPRTGQVLSARTLSKIRAGESGADGAERTLVGLGARPRSSRQDRSAWLRDALDDIGVHRIQHPGMFRYAFPLGENARARRQVRVALPTSDYPKADRDRLVIPELAGLTGLTDRVAG